MKHRPKMTIRLKLVTGYLIIILLLMGIGSVGLYGISKINSNANTIYETNLQSIDKLHTLKELLLEIRYQINYAVIAENTDTTAQATESLPIIINEYETLLSTMDTSSLPDKELTEWNNFTSLSKTYLEMVNKMLDDCNNNVYEMAQAHQAEIDSTRENMFKSIYSIITYNQDNAGVTNTQNQTDFSITKNLILWFTILAFLAALAVSSLTAWYIEKKLRKVLILQKNLEKEI